MIRQGPPSGLPVSSSRLQLRGGEGREAPVPGRETTPPTLAASARPRPRQRERAARASEVKDGGGEDGRPAGEADRELARGEGVSRIE